MSLKNYTTTIPVQKTVGDLQAALVKYGAKSIVVDYADELPVRVNFLYPSKVFGDVHYRVPVDVEAVWRYIFQHGASEGMGPRLRTREQAARIAWRSGLEYIRLQLDYIRVGMVSFEQAMLGYMLAEPERTYYELMTEARLALPPAREG